MWFIFKGLGFRTAKETKTAFQYAALIALSIIDSGETNKLSKAKKKNKNKNKKRKRKSEDKCFILKCIFSSKRKTEKNNLSFNLSYKYRQAH